MRRLSGYLLFSLFAGLVALGLTGCASEDYPLALWEAQHGQDASLPDGGGGGGGGSVVVTGNCHQAQAQSLPARLTAMVSQDGGGAAPSADTVVVSELFDRFNSLCGGCHGPSLKYPNGGFGIGSTEEFVALGSMWKDVILPHVTSNGPTPGVAPADDKLDPMPPFPPLGPGKPYSSRLATDPQVQFVTLVNAWINANYAMSFVVAGSSDAGAGSQNPYLMTRAKANAMTNLGDCIPDPSLVATEKTRAAALDTWFAQSQPSSDSQATAAAILGLPEDLKDTDLYTFDTETLARDGVIAFQPNYPLWSDDAGKIRFVRVPRGQSIHFDKDTQEFTIPANTRFYKTFMKKIVDVDGSYRWRKMETRVIVARPNRQNADGSYTVMSLFGTYQWKSDESGAQLLDTPLRNTLPFADTLIEYNTDEQLAADLLLQNPHPANLDYFMVQNGAARHYAIPSSQRCIDCHEGSPSGTFVLGFRPVELKRRLPGEGGTLIEPGQAAPGADEMTQLQRLIDYGVITGISSPDDVLPLEQSEGDRKPRNDEELTAQGYMVGNCEHCHNPNGLPSVQNPVLKDVLNFVPGPNSGIFQFSLEKVSPRISRGLSGTTPIPYITPSLVDQPADDWHTGREAPGQSTEDYQLKASTGGATDKISWVLYAPWRSLIYRNTQTPFPYTDDLTIFPHMPMNTPGYDCRAQRIFGDWMTSIPAVRKNPQIPEYAYFADPDPSAQQLPVISFAVDDAPQPYVEVFPGDPRYDTAKAAADERRQIFDGTLTGAVGGSDAGGDAGADGGPEGGYIGNPAVPGVKYSVAMGSYCPDTSDVLDPVVVLDPVCHPIPPAAVTNGDEPQIPSPGHAHWINTDLTLPPGPWTPRGDWTHVLMADSAPKRMDTCSADPNSAATEAARQHAEQQVVDLLQSVTLTDAIRTYATNNVPVGLWQKKRGCNFASQATVGSLNPAPQWVANARKVSTVADGDPVYSEWPGAFVFNMICTNCHGPQADGTGRIAQNLLIMTGGDTRVADLRDGLFGPVGTNAGANRAAVFGNETLLAGAGPAWTGPGITVDDRAARYMPWMALGGTEANIPISILNIVGNTQILGVHRPVPGGVASPNMLQAAKVLCGLLLTDTNGLSRHFGLDDGGYFQFSTTANPPFLDHYYPLIATNADAEIWLRLCSIDNPPPVRTLIDFKSPGSSAETPYMLGSSTLFTNPLYSGTEYPASPFTRDAPIGNQTGGVNPSFTADDTYPWCIRVPPADPVNGPAVIPNHNPPLPPCQHLETTNADGSGNPMDANGCTNGCWSDALVDRWATRGAINAGLAVFLYLDGVSKGLTQPQPNYDQCELLH